jgi:hypothetical protein
MTTSDELVPSGAGNGIAGQYRDREYPDNVFFVHGSRPCPFTGRAVAFGYLQNVAEAFNDPYDHPIADLWTDFERVTADA